MIDYDLKLIASAIFQLTLNDFFVPYRVVDVIVGNCKYFLVSRQKCFGKIIWYYRFNYKF